MTENEKIKFLVLYYTADPDIKSRVEQILREASQPSESPDQRSDKGP